MKVGDCLTLTVEKPAAGGRMIARHDAAVILVAAAIPGERVEARIEKVQRQLAWAQTTRVLEASPDRVEAGGDWTCGGNVLAHISYERQTQLKAEIVRDALARIGRIAVPADIPVMPSPAKGYRMRARLHVADGRIGFFREGTHELCKPESTGQLLPATIDVLRACEKLLVNDAGGTVIEIELSENRPADERALHLVLRDGTDPKRMTWMTPLDGLRGVSCSSRDFGRIRVLWGEPVVHDRVDVSIADGTVAVTLARHAHAFFQGNRFLLSALVDAVLVSAPRGRVLDLYAGVGLFAVSLARRGDTRVVAIEGDGTSAYDLVGNALQAGDAIEAKHQSVEAFLAVDKRDAFDTVIVDPPRTGMSKEAMTGAIALAAPQMVYVSCDVATFARDARRLIDAGYRLSSLRAFDLFPTTAHIETLALFSR